MATAVPTADPKAPPKKPEHNDKTYKYRQRYDAFLRSEKYDMVHRIATAIDDHFHHATIIGCESWGCPRVEIPMAELSSFEKGKLARRMIVDPYMHNRALEMACHEIAEEERSGYSKGGAYKIKVAILGPLGAAPMSPRDLRSASLGKLVCLEGVSIKISAIKPKVVKSVHYCAATKKLSSKEYIDATDTHLGLHQVDSSGREIPDRLVNITTSTYPTKDEDGNHLETEYGLSIYKDHQTLTLQEMPERAPVGQLPRSVELMLDHDLVDRVKPGDRVQVVGIYRALAPSGRGQSSTSGVFKTVMLVNSIRVLGRDTNRLIYTKDDIHNIKDIATRKDILQVLGRSICPSILGHDVIKMALVLQLLGGCEKNLENGTHLRGDINILMVGDPSTAKSQLLRAAMTIAPLSISTTGKGSTGVGLTAAVTSDPDTRERRLEAGAMVLGDRGLVCIDEFDKMGEADRIAIHEAMEQQTVTIAKANMHATLNARCSVLAAANPVFGQYDRERGTQDNIGLPDSLLSRFDLLFVVLDQMEADIDRKIAAHVIHNHSYRPGNGVAGHDSDFDDDASDTDGEFQALLGKTKTVWQPDTHALVPKIKSQGKLGENLKGKKAKVAPKPKKKKDDNEDPHANDILQPEFLRKYFHYAKTRMQPSITIESHGFISTRYAEMRANQTERTLPVTVRSLETIIRLATAHAKARLSQTVDVKPDCEAAMKIIHFALYHENSNAGADIEAKTVAALKGDTKEPEKKAGAGATDGEPAAKRARVEDDEIEDGVSVKLMQRIWKQALDTQDHSIPIEQACPDITDRTIIDTAVAKMMENNRIFLSEGILYLI